MQSLNRVFLVVGLISTRSRINKRKDRSSINAGRKLMEEQQHKALLQGLKACETNYRYSISKHGNVSEHELSLWQKQLEDLSASQIMRNFKLHLQNSSFFPTVADIRNAPGLWHESDRKTADQWDPSQALPEPEPKAIPEKAKARLKELMAQALEDPKIKKAWDKKQQAVEPTAYEKPRARNAKLNQRTPMSEEEIKKVFYKKF